MYKVYVWTNKITGKRYVGVTSGSLTKRAGKDGYHYQGSPRFYSSIQRYGLSAFEPVVIAEGLTKEAAAQKERELITLYDTTNPEKGYNLQVGGFPETEMDSLKRAAKIADTLKKERSSPEYRKIMSERMRKVWNNPSSRRAMLDRRIGKYAGRPRTPIYCAETGILYPTLQDAERSLGRAIGFHVGDTCKVIGLRKGPVRTLYRVSVDVKESELRELLPFLEKTRSKPAAEPSSSYEPQQLTLF